MPVAGLKSKPQPSVWALLGLRTSKVLTIPASHISRYSVGLCASHGLSARDSLMRSLVKLAAFISRYVDRQIDAWTVRADHGHFVFLL